MEIKEHVKAILLNKFIETDAPDELLNNTPLISSGILDSISILQLVDVLEKEYGIEFEAHEIDRDKFDSIDLIAELVATKKK
jgi:acyl carrier protein